MVERGLGNVKESIKSKFGGEEKFMCGMKTKGGTLPTIFIMIVIALPYFIGSFSFTFAISETLQIAVFYCLHPKIFV